MDKMDKKSFIQKTTKKEIKLRVKEGMAAKSVVKPRAARLQSKKEYKQAKKHYQLRRKNARYLRKKETTSGVAVEALTKKRMLDAKGDKTVAKKVFQAHQKADPTMVRNQVKGEAKYQAKAKAVQTIVLDPMHKDDTLNEAVEAYQQGRSAVHRVKTAKHLGKSSVKIVGKAGKSTYGLGNRLLNFSMGNGFKRTPEDFKLKNRTKRSMQKWKARRKAIQEAKKAQKTSAVLRSMFRGEKAVGKAASVLAQNPFVLAILGLLLFLFLILGAIAATPQSAVMQDEIELTKTYKAFTEEDAKNSDENNIFYTDFTQPLLYMNYRYEDFKLSDLVPWRLSTFASYVTELWGDLNGCKPEYKFTSMDSLAKDKGTAYHLSEEDYTEWSEITKETQFQALDGQLSFPFQTEVLPIARRFGYEREGESIQLVESVSVALSPGQECVAPMGGVLTIPAENTFLITKEKDARLRLKGIGTGRFQGNETVTEGKGLGNAIGDRLQITYEKYDVESDKWQKVNPAFYFPKVTYMQVTSLGNSDFSPQKDMADRAKTIYDFLMKKGYTRQGICAILGNFQIESSINPKRAEGDYLKPPVGASGNCWDDDNWLNMGNNEIYGGKFPLIIHRGIGLGQWTDTADGSTRGTMLRNYAKSKNKKWYDLELQLDFMLNGDTPASKTMFVNTVGSKVGTTVPELTTYFLTHWEGNPGDKLQQRIQAAQNWYNYFSGSAADLNGTSKENFEKYKDKIAPLPTNKEMKDGWGGNAYALGNCTWWVYNRMAQLGKHIHPTMGNANQWVQNYVQTPGARLVSEPKRGDAIIFTNGAAGSHPTYGHVAMVEYVNSDGSFLISEMNVQGAYSMGWRVLTKQPNEYFMRVE
ncbi:CHAP domain-containing protein [Pilibacter termitis]|uniref:CHAP domain-containing protein n=1 Tax=Pilibacter termitis TaxID=263852 RepID=A0A1T4KT50_9ENTE|nr:phage tail tip lysozyme [Pilibacter termitis]SJZ45530.1 CHAP domain-containing protein [Pilibacter termitis]